MKNWKSILTALALASASSIAAAQEVVAAEATPQKAAATANQPVLTEVNTKYGVIKVKKEIIDDTAVITITLDPAPADTSSAELSSAIASVLMTLVPEESAGVQAFAAALANANLPSKAGQKIQLVYSSKNAAKPNFEMTMGDVKIGFTPEVSVGEASSMVKGNVVVTDEQGNKTETTVDLNVPANGGSVTGTVGGSQVSFLVTPPAVVSPSTGSAAAGSEASVTPPPDNTVEIPVNEISGLR